LTLDPIQPGPPKTENYVNQPDPTQPNPWMDPTHVHLWSTVFHSLLEMDIMVYL